MLLFPKLVFFLAAAKYLNVSIWARKYHEYLLDDEAEGSASLGDCNTSHVGGSALQRW